MLPSSKLLPILSFKKPLHPAYVCWYNSCEKLADWAIDAGIAASINKLVFQENIGSIDLNFPSDATRYARLTPVPCNIYSGLWARFVDVVPDVFRYQWLGTPQTQYVTFYIDVAHRWAFEVYVQDASHAYSSDITIAPNTWYWLEHYFEASLTQHRFYVDGVNKWICGGYPNIGAYSLFQARNSSGFAGHTLIDYVRISDRLEYPPL